MIEVEQEARKRVERALIVGVSYSGEDPGRVHAHLDELTELLGNLDIEVVGRTVAKLKGAPHAQYYVGTGKAEEIAAELKAKRDAVIAENKAAAGLTDPYRHLVSSERICRI